MILKELMRERFDVYKVTEQASLAQVAAMMQDKKVGSIVVVDSTDSVVGIITDRDIALALALGGASSNSFVDQVMTAEVDTIYDSMNLFDVTRYFRTACVKRLPVVNERGKLQGIVSVDDVMAMLAREMFDTCSSLEPKLGHMV